MSTSYVLPGANLAVFAATMAVAFLVAAIFGALIGLSSIMVALLMFALTKLLTASGTASMVALGVGGLVGAWPFSFVLAHEYFPAGAASYFLAAAPGVIAGVIYALLGFNPNTRSDRRASVPGRG